MSTPQKDLLELVRRWDKESLLSPHYHWSFRDLLEEIFFHAELRFIDYIQYRNEGEFPLRLKRWIDNVSSNREKKALFQLLRFLIFIDRLQLQSLYRDAYRRVIAPWVSLETLFAEDILSHDYEIKVRSLLHQYRFFSITESFNFPDFLHNNDLHGLPRPTILGENKRKVKGKLPPPSTQCKGLIIFEDFVGTGKQALGVLAEVRRNTPSEWKILFVPLMILKKGLTTLATKPELTNITIEPILVVPKVSCLQKVPTKGEPPEFVYIRGLVNSTARHVIGSFGPHDDPPGDAFGYGGCGALLVTCHNTPNNTLTLIHHRSPNWSPLFRRLHHSKDGLR